MDSDDNTPKTYTYHPSSRQTLKLTEGQAVEVRIGATWLPGAINRLAKHDISVSYNHGKNVVLIKAGPHGRGTLALDALRLATPVTT